MSDAQDQSAGHLIEADRLDALEQAPRDLLGHQVRGPAAPAMLEHGERALDQTIF